MAPRYWYGLDRWINPLGFGAWQLAGEYFVNGKPQGWGKLDTKEAIRLIHHALDNGIQIFDTAAGYGHGRSEELIGQGIAASSAKESAVICTKIVLTTAEEQAHQLAPDFPDRVAASLRRLNRDRIDVLLLHSPPDGMMYAAIETMLEDLQRKGLIGTYGVSCRSLQGAKNIIDQRFGNCLEWSFNMLERRPVAELFPDLASANMNFIARSPLSRGLLASRYLKEDPAFDSDNFRSTLPQDWIDWVVASIRRLADRREVSENLSKLAIRYCLQYDEVSAVIPGIRDMRHLEDFIQAAKENKPSPDFMDYLASTTESHYPGWA